MKSKKHDYLKQAQDITLPLRQLKGVGPKRSALLAGKGLHTILDLFLFTPIRYEDRTRVTPISQAKEGSIFLVKGKVVHGKEERYYPRHKRLFRIIINDAQGSLELIWFQYNKPHLLNLINKDKELLVYGKVIINNGRRQIIHPDISILGKSVGDDVLGFYPVYSSVNGISGNLLRALIRSSLESYLEKIVDPIPRKITNRINLPEFSKALQGVHFPSKNVSIKQLNRFNTPSHKRLTFDQFFFVMLAIAYRKRKREKVRLPVQIAPKDLYKKMRGFFKFDLTSHQLKAVEEVMKDLGQGKPMNRLLMGDVGCGKTVVAVMASYVNVKNNKQVAIMAPTQILADQHLRYFSELPKEMGFRPVLLTGEIGRVVREEIYEGIANGSYNVIIGTHAIIQDKVSFFDLGLVVIDEQHRFGVRQRALVKKKGNTPHMLVMTATPIPRTLAITAYGDMDISIINEYPEGHGVVETHLVGSEQKRWMFERLKQRLNNGYQAFVICPVIDSSEDEDLKSALDMERRIKKILSPPFNIGLIHGRLAQGERFRIMDDFRKGSIHLLVSTTVIEVGVHVPNATIMVVEHPERFGLAQLHQLRGRIGRGKSHGICFLMSAENLSENALSRIKVLVEENEGFKVAQKDLELRGPGELTGIRQSGIGDLDFTEMFREPELLLAAKQEAHELIDADPELKLPEHSHLKLLMDSMTEAAVDY